VSKPVAVAELLAAYAATAQRWHELRGSARAANPVFDDNARRARELRRSPGPPRRDRRPARTSRERRAAAGGGAESDHYESEAVAALEALAGGSDLQAIAAGYALEEVRAGRLELDG